MYNKIFFLYAFLLSIVLCLLVFEANADTKYFNWGVKYEYKSPDCFKKLAITINGETPGPTIYAVQGDIVVVNVTNRLLTESLTIHWHGIRQINTSWFDGTEAVSQCPIVPGDTFTYEFVVDRAGTYLYHAHYGMQREAGLNGMIIVNLPHGKSEPFKYDDERSILLTDWYHKNTYEAATGLLSKDPAWVWVGEPQSLLIQGRGSYNCSLVSMNAHGSHFGKCNNSNPECSLFNLTVESGKTYRLRIGSLTSLSAFNFAIEGHNMMVVETDGHYVEPFLVGNLFIYSGETYSVLVTANQTVDNYWIKSNVVSREPKTSTGLAIFSYSSKALARPSTDPTPGPKWNATQPRIAQSHKIVALQGHIDYPPQNPNRTIVLLNTQNKINGYTKWALNNVSLTLPTTPYLVALKDPRLADKISDIFDNRTEPPVHYNDWENYDIGSVAPNTNAVHNSGIYRLGYSAVVDVVLQNANTMKPNTSETHPWHLHGHDFWVLGYGTGKFNISSDPGHYDLKNPIMKNAVPLHPHGWTALRFKADNPGVWLFHCHIDSHFLMGMGVVFEEGVELVGELPSSIMGCGMTKEFYNQPVNTNLVSKI